MTYLLDTHTLIWSILNTSQLGKKSKQILINKENEIYVSTISLWEISLKVRMKKYSFEGLDINEIPKQIKDMGFTIICLDSDEAITYSNLALKEEHKDPFDRMLIWQAIRRNLTMISKDRKFEDYKENGLKLIW